MSAPHPRRVRADLGLSVVIPAYNEERRLRATLETVGRYLAASAASWEVIVVDDGSTDGTARLVRAAAGGEPRIRLLASPVNRGKGSAVRLGVLASRGRRVLFCDADQATPIEELAGLAAALDRGADAAIGSRAGSAARDGRPALRRGLGRAGNRFIQAVAVPGIHDTQCGFKLFDGDKARAAFALARIDGWGFDVEILLLFTRLGWTVAEVPVRWAHQPGSKVRPLDYARVLGETLRVRLGRVPAAPAASR
ncbi:dolichyl-phosphate beta-glucosyltransferase [Streptomyces capparidis]